MEECIVVVYAVDVFEIVVSDIFKIPSSHEVGVGMTSVMYILRAEVDGFCEVLSAPCIVLSIYTCKIVIFWYTDSSVTMFFALSDDKFKEIAAVSRSVIHDFTA